MWGVHVCQCDFLRPPLLWMLRCGVSVWGMLFMCTRVPTAIPINIQCVCVCYILLSVLYKHVSLRWMWKVKQLIYPLFSVNVHYTIVLQTCFTVLFFTNIRHSFCSCVCKTRSPARYLPPRPRTRPQCIPTPPSPIRLASHRD